jgi:hypothetical protein
MTGCTRAMDNLFLIRADVRSMHGKGAGYRMPTRQSRFLSHLKKTGISIVPTNTIGINNQDN